MESTTERVTAPPERHLGRYTLLGKLAEGGMAEVYLARQDGPQGFAKIVVIKKILPHLAQDVEFVQMFLNEARVAALINHPNVVSISELCEDAATDTYYMVMEHLDGCNLKRLADVAFERQRPIAPGIAARIVADAAAGLDFAHRLTGPGQTPLKIVHRDVSPDNIIVTYSGLVKVVDFGIAKIARSQVKTRLGDVKGKTGYLSPEQLLDKKLDGRTDVWALGVTLYWLLAGQRPFQAAGQSEVFQKILKSEPPPLPPHVPTAFRRIVSKALAKSPEARHASAGALQAELEGWLEQSGQHVGTSALAAYVNELFPAASDPERLLTRGILSGDRQESLDGGDAASPAAVSETSGVFSDTTLPDAVPPVAPTQANRHGEARRPPEPARPTAMDPDFVTERSKVDPETLAAPEPPAPRPLTAKRGEPAGDLQSRIRAGFGLRRPRLALGGALAACLVAALALLLVHRGAAENGQAGAAGGDVTFTINSVPPGAALVLDDRPTGLLTPVRFGHWDASVPHLVSIELDGFLPYRRTLAPGRRPADLDVVLSPGGKITATTLPPGAAVRLDGTAVGKTPISFAAAAGKDVEVAIDLAGYVPVSQTVRLVQGQDLPLDRALTPLAWVWARSEPAGAQLVLDGKPAGTAPARLPLTPVEVHHLDLRVPGFPPETREVKVGAGQQADVEVRFEDAHDQSARAEVDRIEKRLAADRDAIERLHAPGGAAAAEPGAPSEADLTEEAARFQALAAKLKDELARHQQELEQRIQEANRVPPL